MGKQRQSVTPAIRELRRNDIDHTVLPYDYVDSGGARHAAEALSVPLEHVVKTLVFEADGKHPLLVLMTGDREVSVKTLARCLGVKRVAPCDRKTAEKLTGYKVGGISPFGTRQRMPVYVESEILELERIYINGGKRGVLVAVPPRALSSCLGAEPVSVAVRG
jgi:Cys-tRNA(Pro) deacylase